MEAAPDVSFRELAPGARIGKYRVVRRLARGGMAEVYLARDSGPAGVERLVALKLILPHMAGEARFLSMFMGEVRVAATLDHPNIAQVLDVGEVKGEPYLVMEYVHGRTVQSVLRKCADRPEPIPIGTALEIVTRACAGLHYAHERTDIGGQRLQIVHRDVSPSNLMVRYDGTVKLLDFGIAKAASQTSATATGFFKGKAGYMSPEQCADESVDRRSDIFNLGILLYELTTSRRAFFGDNPVAVINKIANARFERPSLIVDGYPPELEAIVLRAMAPDPEHRYETAEEMLRALEKLAQAKQFDVSAVALAGLMEELYGDQPYPSVQTEMTPLPLPLDGGDSGAITISTAKRSSWRPWMSASLAGAVLVGAVGAAWALSRPEPAQAEPAPAGAAPPTVISAPVPVPTPAGVARQPDAPPVVVGTPPPATPTPSKSRPTAKKKKRPKKKRPPKKKAKPRNEPEGMYP